MFVVKHVCMENRFQDYPLGKLLGGEARPRSPERSDDAHLSIAGGTEDPWDHLHLGRAPGANHRCGVLAFIACFTGEFQG